MGTFIRHDYIVSPEEIGREAERIEATVRRNGGILASYGYGFSCPGSGQEEPINGWLVRKVDTRGMGNHGSFVAIAATPETYAVQEAATLRLLRQWADAAEMDGTMSERGDFECRLVPLLMSEFAPRGLFLGRDDKWAYFAHPHQNFVRVGDARHRLWVRLVRGN